MVGFKDKNGKIILDPKYLYADEFHNGRGRVRIDKDGAYEWKYIDTQGNLYDYDEVRGFYCGFSPVSKNGKYGFINTAGELVVPLIYDEIYCLGSNEGWSAYAVKDGVFIFLDLKKGYEESFERYDLNKGSKYNRTIDLKDYNITVVNDMLIVNGSPPPSGYFFPLIVFQGLDFDLYKQNKRIGTYKAIVTQGDYQGELRVSFPEYDKLPVHDNPEGYYAVLSSSKIGFREVRKTTNTDGFNATVTNFLKEKNIEKTDVSIDAAFEGDFYGNGVTGAVIEINDNYRRDGVTSQSLKEIWSREKFADGKKAFVNSIILIVDISKPMEYKIIESNLWNHTSFEYKTSSVKFIANLDADNRFELITMNSYYEGFDYSAIDL